MSKENWQSIYSAGQQLNKYPYEFVVSNYYNYKSRRGKADSIRVLDLGCGGGNNALFCAENGANVIALDYSEAALEVVKQRALERNLLENIEARKADFENMDLGNIDIDIDFVIDRLSVSHVSRKYAINIYNQVYERMNTGGLIVSNIFSTGHAHKNYGIYNSNNDIWEKFTDGIFRNLKSAYFYDETEIRELFNKYSLLSLTRETENDLVADKGQYEMWKIVAEKR